ncbi:MAG: hypothetical protein DCC52_16570 [Chloroflexi bacterium]|nr:MAG: hypothetical protein DCC52_16570 [Chloroflexota bacterium]
MNANYYMRNFLYGGYFTNSTRYFVVKLCHADARQPLALHARTRHTNFVLPANACVVNCVAVRWLAD